MATRNRSGNRQLGRSGARIRRVQAGQVLGVSDSVASMFLPANGGKLKSRRVLERCAKATLGPVLDENGTSGMESVGLPSGGAEAVAVHASAGVAGARGVALARSSGFGYARTLPSCRGARLLGLLLETLLREPIW